MTLPCWRPTGQSGSHVGFEGLGCERSSRFILRQATNNRNRPHSSAMGLVRWVAGLARRKTFGGCGFSGGGYIVLAASYRRKVAVCQSETIVAGEWAFRSDARRHSEKVVVEWAKWEEAARPATQRSLARPLPLSLSLSLDQTDWREISPEVPVFY